MSIVLVKPPPSWPAALLTGALRLQVDGLLGRLRAMTLLVPRANLEKVEAMCLLFRCGFRSPAVQHWEGGGWRVCMYS